MGGIVLDFTDLLFIILLLLLSTAAIVELIYLCNQKKVIRTAEKTRQLLYETVEKISKTHNEDEIYSIILDTIVTLVPNAVKGSILLKNAAENFSFQEIIGYEEELKSVILKKEEVYLYKMNQFKETVIIDNPRKFNKQYNLKKTIDSLDEINALEISCTISAPIYIDEEFIGIINVDAEKKGYIFKEKDLQLMNQLKSELQLALKNAVAQNRLKYLANYDVLTGIMNRFSLKEECDQKLEKSNRKGETFCFAMLDLDNFKSYNDTYGHNFGDSVLVHFTSILKDKTRESDAIGRFAGDEFIIIFRDTNMDTAKKIMGDLEEEVELKKLAGITIEFSYGICEVKPGSNMNFDKILTLADENMYIHKKQKMIERCGQVYGGTEKCLCSDTVQAENIQVP